jgi:hypothetical protein
MWFFYLWEVVKRAFTPTPRVTDGLQIAAASALPAAAKFVGLELGETASNDALAYIGLVALAFVAIRLFWAPYAIWKEQGGEIGELKLELSKPERLIVEHLARHRAKARAKLAAVLEDWQAVSFSKAWDDAAERHNTEYFSKAMRLQAEAGLSQVFQTGRRAFALAIREEAEATAVPNLRDMESERLLRLLQRHLVGDLTAEDLALQLPRGTVPKIQP